MKEKPSSIPLNPRPARPAAGPGGAAKPLSLRDEHKRLTRERLEASALNLFETQGYRGTSVHQIAKGAGTTHTTLYQHFKGKAELAERLVQRAVPEIEQACRRLDSIEQPSRADLRAWMNDYALIWQRIHGLLDAIHDAAMTDPEVAGRIVPSSRDTTAVMTRLLGRYPAGKARKRAHERLVMMLLMLERVLFLVHVQQQTPAEAEMLDDFADLFWQSLFVQAPLQASLQASAQSAAKSKARV